MTKALVVEDDMQVMDGIVDTLFTLGHEHEWVTNLQDARDAMARGDVDYGLFDLEIPAKPGRGFANTESRSWSAVGRSSEPCSSSGLTWAKRRQSGTWRD